MPKRAMVTGGSGFLGSVVARTLVEDGHEVHMVTRPGSDPWRLSGIDANCHAVDLQDASALHGLLRAARPDWIFHLAAHGAYSSQTDARRMVEANVLGTMNLVHGCIEQGFEAFVNTGSSSEYGIKDHAPGEDELAEPNSDYAVTKLAQTAWCRLAARKHAVHLPTLRLYSVYGPYEDPRRFVPTLIVRGLAGSLPPLVSPDVARDFVYTDDVARAFVLAATRKDVEPGAIYNVGTGRQTTVREAVGIARARFDIRMEPDFATMPDRTWDTTSWVADANKIATELGWKPTISFEEGIGRFASWLENSPLRASIYSRALGSQARGSRARGSRAQGS